jgi:excisionase family DNA binding protein
MEAFLTVVEAASKLGIRQDSVYRALQTRRLPAEKDAAGHWQIPAAAIAERLRRRSELSPLSPPNKSLKPAKAEKLIPKQRTPFANLGHNEIGGKS